jgi:hypothetical protein
MIDPFLKAKAEKLSSQLSNAIPIDALNEKYAASTPEEKAKFDAVQKKAVAYFKAGDLEGLKKYIKYIKPKL